MAYAGEFRESAVNHLSGRSLTVGLFQVMCHVNDNHEDYEDSSLASAIDKAEDDDLEVVMTEWEPGWIPFHFSFCVCYKSIPNRYVDRAYFSSIFRSEGSVSSSTKEAFVEYYDCLVGKGSTCETYPSATQARDALQDARHYRRLDLPPGGSTNWKPEGLLDPKPLQDFNITIPDNDRTVNVCIRDYECEDGDRVRVSVNGSTIFSDHELFNDWACESVPVNEGENSIELHAINGSGRKGACDYRDANTGQLRVEGQNADTQGWKHRGGAGSSAKIVVTVQ